MPGNERSANRAALAGAGEDVVIEFARAGHSAAFEELVRRRHGQLRQLLARLCNDRSLADDLAQETFVRAWRALPALRANPAFWQWLRRIGVRVWAQHLQQQRIRLADSFDDNALAHSESAEEPAASDRIDLDAALARLTPAARACMVLAYQAGMSHSEIAVELALPLGTVKTHINRSTQTLRVWFGSAPTE